MLTDHDFTTAYGPLLTKWSARLSATGLKEIVVDIENAVQSLLLKTAEHQTKAGAHKHHTDIIHNSIDTYNSWKKESGLLVFVATYLGSRAVTMTLDDIITQVINNTNRPDLGKEVNGGDGQIVAAVLSATLTMHTCDLFWRDIVESDVVFPNVAYLQTLDITTLPRFRQLAGFRKWDSSIADNSGAFGELAFGDGGFGNPSNSNSAGLLINDTVIPTSTLPNLDGWNVNPDLAFKELQVVDIGGLFDSYGTQRQDIVYGAGTSLRIKSSTPLKYGRVAYYAYPLIDPPLGAAYVSWIAETYPWAIIYAAEAITYANTGDLDAHRVLVRPSNYKTGDPGGLVTQHMQALKNSNIEVSGR